MRSHFGASQLVRRRPNPSRKRAYSLMYVCLILDAAVPLPSTNGELQDPRQTSSETLLNLCSTSAQPPLNLLSSVCPFNLMTELYLNSASHYSSILMCSASVTRLSVHKIDLLYFTPLYSTQPTGLKTSELILGFRTNQLDLRLLANCQFTSSVTRSFSEKLPLIRR